MDGANAAGKHSTLAFSQATSFHMSSAPQKRLAIALAAFSESGGNLMQIASSGHEIDVTDEGSLTVMLPSAGSVEVTIDGRSYRASGGEGLCFGPSRRQTRVAGTDAADFEAYLLKMPVATLAGQGADSVPFDTRDPFVPAATGAAPALSDLIAYVFSSLESSGLLLVSEKACALADALVQEHVRKLVEPALGADDTMAPAPLRKVRQAEEFMRAHFAEPLRVADIADAVGLASRSLEAAFRRVSGSAPWARLRSIRLEQARRRLLMKGAQDSVTAIALECGFTHLGRFSQLYKKSYGELPSETLRRGRKLN